MGGGPPAFPPDSSCPVVLRIPASSISFHLRDCYPLRFRFPTVFGYEIFRLRRSIPQGSVDPRFGLFPVRSPLLRKSMFLRLLRCFSSPGSLRYTMDSCNGDTLSCTGFPHSDIHGSMHAYCSPWLFAVNHVLRRLLVPRHSPCALISLIF